MTEHPLTDEILDKFGTDDQQFAFELATKWEPTRIYLDDDMRSAADWQLERCLEFLRTHPFHERDDYDWSDAYAYAQLMEEAMRPTKALAGTGREGALNALDRLYKENDKGLRRLAQEDN